MSDGQKKGIKDATELNVVTLDQDEFNKVCRRVHFMLMSRAEKAREKKEKRPTKRSNQNYIEASKEIFVFVHLMELVESMAEEITDLRSILSVMSERDGSRAGQLQVPDVFFSNKKHYPN
jgi:hypothetical protein